MKQESSYRTILRSSSIMGMASALNILVGLLKMKVVAILLGPVAVGFIGIYQNLMQTASTVSAMGLNLSGTRQIAAASAEDELAAVGRVRRALFWGTLILALIGSLIFWLTSGWIAQHILNDPARHLEVAWLSLGVALTVAAGSQSALLVGLRRIGDLARMQLISGILGAVIGILAIEWWGNRGVLAMVLIAPLTTLLTGHWYVNRLGRPEGPYPRLIELAQEWRVMVTVGFAFMLSALITTLGQLVLRSLVQRTLGPVALGQFQATWMIGMTYLTFVLSAMSNDYYPRLTAAINDREAAVRIVNEQTEVALLLSGPVLLAMLTFVPWVIRLLYSPEFAPAMEILRWQLLGDVLKVMSWPLGFVLLAAGASKTFLMTETSGIIVFVGCTALMIPIVGVVATGIGFLALYIWYLPLVYFLARARMGFYWHRKVINQCLALALAAVLISALAHISDALAAGIGTPLTVGFALYGFVRLGQVAGLEGRLGNLAALGQRMINSLGIRS